MLLGMGNIAELMGPANCLSSPMTKLLEVYRYLEITRAISYGTDSVLPQWASRRHTSDMPADRMDQSMEFMLRGAALNQRYFFSCCDNLLEFQG
jgi:hypothetical protein